jgi:hypothetical protein
MGSPTTPRHGGTERSEVPRVTERSEVPRVTVTVTIIEFEQELFSPFGDYP